MRLRSTIRLHGGRTSCGERNRDKEKENIKTQISTGGISTEWFALYRINGPGMLCALPFDIVFPNAVLGGEAVALCGPPFGAGILTAL